MANIAIYAICDVNKRNIHLFFHKQLGSGLSSQSCLVAKLPCSSAPVKCTPVAYPDDNFAESASPVSNYVSQPINEKVFCPVQKEILSPVIFGKIGDPH